MVPEENRLVVNLPHLLAEPIYQLAKGSVDFNSVAVLTPVFVDYDDS